MFPAPAGGRRGAARRLGGAALPAALPALARGTAARAARPGPARGHPGDADGTLGRGCVVEVQITEGAVDRGSAAVRLPSVVVEAPPKVVRPTVLPVHSAVVGSGSAHGAAENGSVLALGGSGGGDAAAAAVGGVGVLGNRRMRVAGGVPRKRGRPVIVVPALEGCLEGTKRLPRQKRRRMSGIILGEVMRGVADG